MADEPCLEPRDQGTEGQERGSWEDEQVSVGFWWSAEQDHTQGPRLGWCSGPFLPSVAFYATQTWHLPLWGQLWNVSLATL